MASAGSLPVDDKKSPAAQGDVTAPVAPPVCFVKDLCGTFNGKEVEYRAIAAETYIRDGAGMPVASFFAVTYLSKEDTASRPVAFIFNGGPGSSTQWLHMGAFGPKRATVPSVARSAGAPPYPLLDNPASILDACDLVFIDTVGTGYSRALGAKTAKDFWGLMADARSVADFIQSWLSEHRRWNSPKYLIGESYGTTRAALVADVLSTRYISLNGIVLISAVLDYQNSRPRVGDGAIMPYVSFLPSYAAVAWYHGKIAREGRTLAAFLTEVRTFARTQYAQGLIANRLLESAERAQLVRRVAAYTGLAEEYVEASNLRILPARFFKELLRAQRLAIGRLDGRYTGVEADSAAECAESDPSFDAIGGAYTAALNAYLGELGVSMPRPYQSMKLIEEWNWVLEERTPNGGGYVNVVPHLGRAMRRNPALRVFVASGYYDLATPFFGAENALWQDGIAHERVSYTYYEVGHMIFVHEPSGVRLLEGVRDFLLGPGA